MRQTARKLQRIYKNAKVIPFDNDSSFVFMSDCHRGQGTLSDNFMPNSLLFTGALSFYSQKGFAYMELGDGDELWENRKLSPIICAHKESYDLMARLHQEGRFYMLFGNHDIVKRRQLTTDKYYKTFFCHRRECLAPLLPGITVHEGLILRHKASGQEIFAVHGHQGSLLNDTLWMLARFLVRYIWKPLELIGVRQPLQGGCSPRAMKSAERRLSDFATRAGVLLIAGHTHKPHFAQRGKELYFNDGSCVHPGYITAIELEMGKLSLVEWKTELDESRHMYVARRVIKGPVAIEDFFEKA